MNVANSPVPIAAVSYQKFIFFNRDTTCSSYYSKKSQYDTFVGQIMFVTEKFHYSEGGKSLLMN